MNRKRLSAFCLTVLTLALVVSVTLPSVWSNIRLGLDLKGGFEILYEAYAVVPGSEVTPEALRRTARSLEERVNALGTAEPEIWTESGNRIRVRLAGVDDEEKIRAWLRKPAVLTINGPNGEVELQGTDFKENKARVVLQEGMRYAIQVEVNDKNKLAEMSERLLYQTITFNLDDRMLTNPVVQAIMDNGIMRIIGDFTYEEASEIADIINMGSLPLKLVEKYNQSVGASLGSQSLNSTLLAGAIGSALLLLFMLLVYRIPGVIASVTLITYGWLLLFCFNMLQATMTLPGIAAFILGMGMAVDANIITYERLKEEIHSGKSLMSSVREAAKHSSRSILDANITTLIAGFVLFSIGTGAIKGFALTLILSIVISVLTNVYLSQWLLRMLVSTQLFRSVRWFGIKPQVILAEESKSGNTPLHSKSRFLFFRHAKMNSLFVVALVCIGVVSLLLQGLNIGVDFKAGTSIDIQLTRSTEYKEVVHIVEDAGYAPNAITVGGENGEWVSIRFDKVFDQDGREAARLEQAFSNVFGPEVSSEAFTVDPDMAREFARNAGIAVLLAIVGIFFFIWLRFDRRFAAAAVATISFDVFVIVTVFSLLQLEVNLPFIAAILTIIGYSINDTIVIFDRIRENLRKRSIGTVEELQSVVNLSLNQTLARSLHTVLCVLFASVAILLWGSDSIRLFSLSMTIGLVVGVYSSLFLASQLWLTMTARRMRHSAYSSLNKRERYRLEPFEHSYEE